MNKIKVLQFPIANSNGGLTRYAVNNFRYLDKNRFSCDFATVSKRLDFEDELRAMGAGVHYISCRAEENRRQFASEIRALLSGNYDAVHLHTAYWKSFLVEQIAKECQIPRIIVHAHATCVDVVDEDVRKREERVHESVKKQFDISLATDFCACSKAAADFLFGPQIPRERIQILNNAIELDRFRPREEVRTALRREMGLEGCFVIGSVGRLSYVKNYEFLIDVFAEVSRRDPAARLLLVGDGSLMDDLKAQTGRLGLEHSVIFTGVRSDVHHLLQAMDVFCLPSRFEGFPIVLVEAQTSGLKCLASDRITPEVELTDCVERIPLEAALWSERLTALSEGYERRDRYDELTAKGFNIREAIKRVEALYQG